jgi:hypothetical protein
MALLSEFAITPHVFDSAFYSSPDLCGAHLLMLKNVLLDQGLVRDLRDRGWSSYFASGQTAWHLRGKELLNKLTTQRRLICFPSVLSTAPADDPAWCREAVATDVAPKRLTGIITSAATAPSFAGNAAVASVEKLGSTSWWPARTSSVRTSRKISDYIAALDLVLRHSNSLMLIDPHLQPSKRQYSEFVQILTHAGHRSPAPLIELHRVCYEGSGPNRSFPALADFETEFRSAFSSSLAGVGLTCEVFIWDDFHDRFVISNLAGISVSNGFDTSSASNARVTWTRLSRDDRDDVQREFDAANTVHNLRHRFSVP